MWTHIGLICPATVASVALFGLVLHNSRDELDTVYMILGVSFIICVIGKPVAFFQKTLNLTSLCPLVVVLDALYSSIQFLLKIEVEEEARLARRERNLSRARAL